MRNYSDDQSGHEVRDLAQTQDDEPDILPNANEQKEDLNCFDGGNTSDADSLTEQSDPKQENNLSALESTNNCDNSLQITTSNKDHCPVELAIIRPRKVVPLSGTQYFTCILSNSSARSPYQLVIPRNFYPFLPSTVVPVTLCCDDRSWELKYYGDRSLKRFDIAWKDFVIDNCLKVGDACIFELLDTKNLTFRVQILDGELPNFCKDDLEACNSSAPISAESPLLSADCYLNFEEYKSRYQAHREKKASFAAIACDMYDLEGLN